MKVKNLENQVRRYAETLGNFHVLEYLRDASVSPGNAAAEFYMAQMNVRRRQVVIELDRGHSAIVQSGSMQWTAGLVQAATGVKGVGDLFGKAVRGAVTGESAVKPEYQGEGLLVLEPTFKYIILQDIASWGQGGMTIEDGMFLASDSRVRQSVVSRRNISSAALGGEGLFNLNLSGAGIVALESNVPSSELIEVVLEGDELRIDGSMAVCWSGSLSFTVERSTRTLTGSAVSGEGLVNVYRGHGKVLMSPVALTSSLQAATNAK